MQINLRNVGVGENKWYGEVRKSRTGWKVVYRLGVERCREEKSQQALHRKRHKCIDER